MVPPVAASVALYTAPCVPLDKELVLMLTGTTETVMLRAFVAVCAVGVVESVTCTVKLNVPEEVGVPEIVPVEAARFKPAGKDPEPMLQEYGVNPPLAARVAL